MKHETQSNLKTGAPVDSETVPVIRQSGHRFVRAERIWVRCVDCGLKWPHYGDLAPLPVCGTENGSESRE